MAVTGPIPLPPMAGSTLSDIPEMLERMRLMRAQSQEATGKAAQSEMLAKLINSAMSGSGSGGGMQGSNPLLLSALMHFPTTSVDGQVVTPFGNVKVGESGSEKRMGESQAQIQTAQGKTDIGKSKSIEDSTRSLGDTISSYEALLNLFEKNPNLTNPLNSFKKNKFYNVSSDPDLGTFTETAGNLQSALTKLFSARGGVGAAKLAGTLKPTDTNTVPFNIGMIKSGLRRVQNEHQLMKKDWESYNPGKTFPYENPEIDKLIMKADAIAKGKRLPSQEISSDNKKSTSISNDSPIMPSLKGFSSKEQFQSWYKKQSPETQAAVRKQLQERGQ